MREDYQHIIENGRRVIENRTEDTWFENGESVRTVLIEMQKGDISISVEAGDTFSGGAVGRLVMQDNPEQERESRMLSVHIPEGHFYKASVGTGSIKGWWELDHSER